MPEGRSGWPPDDEYPEVAQSGWSPEDEYLEETWSPRVELVDAVAEGIGGYGSAGRSVNPAQTLGESRFTSTSVPMYACMQGSPVGTSIGVYLRL